MQSWRDMILNHFKHPLSHLVIVTDPDGLLQDEEILSVLKDKEIELVTFQDRATFRYLYEKYYRGYTGKTLLIYLEHDQVDVLPFDVTHTAQVIDLRISLVFPRYSQSIIRQLDGHTLDALYDAPIEHLQGTLSDQATCDFLLRKVYKLAYDIVESKEELVRLLIKKHENDYFVPQVLDEFLMDYFTKHHILQSLPITQLIESKVFFYQYLQNEWEEYINYLKENQHHSKEHSIGNYYRQQLLGNYDSMKYVFNQLFLEGKLKPIEYVDAGQLPKWTHVGIQSNTQSMYKLKTETLIKKIENFLDLPLNYKQWAEVAQWICELKYGIHTTKDHFDLSTIEHSLKLKFEAWMLKEYQTLSNLPYVNHPVMLHHIPHFLRLQQSKKKALIVLDGMSFIQWAQIEEYLSQEFHFEVHGTFSWVPTITSISRQAIFTGEPPLYYGETLHTTYKEPASWQLFWEKESISKLHISYQKGLGQGTYDRDQILALQKSNTKIAGLVIDTIDKLMHGSILGHKGMIAAIHVWLQKGYLKQLLQDLFNAGYDIYITSDHGNQECTGIGQIQEGVLADSRGTRVRMYNNEYLRDQAARSISSIIWPNIGLPMDRFMLLANTGEAFIKKGEQVVSHGGISLEEVIVPFVHVTKKREIQ